LTQSLARLLNAKIVGHWCDSNTVDKFGELHWRMQLYRWTTSNCISADAGAIKHCRQIREISILCIVRHLTTTSNGSFYFWLRLKHCRQKWRFSVGWDWNIARVHGELIESGRLCLKSCG
jgi:hypothetical protein